MIEWIKKMIGFILGKRDKKSLKLNKNRGYNCRHRLIWEKENE